MFRSFGVIPQFCCTTGLGNPLSPERTRMLLALRINVLAKGHSGVSLETLHAMIQAFNGTQPNPQTFILLTFGRIKA